MESQEASRWPIVVLFPKDWWKNTLGTRRVLISCEDVRGISHKSVGAQAATVGSPSAKAILSLG